ncbi:MAG: SpoIIE family protein phosphatase [Victivallales bacterium]|nr:SpoIIE family protein phosphatase [Victivallales bacterium]
MKKTFQRWLFGVVLAAFILTFLGSYIVQTALSRRAAEILIGIKLKDACAQLDNACKNYNQIAEITSEKALLHADYLALWLKSEPEIIHQQNSLDRMRNTLKANQLRIFNAAGVQIAAVPKNLKTEPVPAFIMRSGRDVREVIAHKFRAANGTDDIEHDVYLSRLDSPGFIFLKFYSRSLNEAHDLKDIKLFAEGFRIGAGGGMIIARGNDILCDGTLDIKKSKLSELSLSRIPDKNLEIYNNITIDSTAYFGVKRKYLEYYIIGLLPLSELYARRNQLLLLLSIGYVILFSVVFWAITALVEHKVITGIERICVSLDKITAGDLHARVDVRSSPEFLKLSCGINSMVSALREAISEAGRRYENELKLAAAIQASALPRIDSLRPHPDGIELYAAMLAAREVGGDFYDFFWIDDKHFAFLIADVSEKGIPAALFMMSAKTWIKSLAKSGLDPAAVFTEANRMLCLDNDTGMFVTVFFGILEPDSGKLTCINAGHNPPLLRRAGGNYEFLRLKPDFILGPLPDAEYRQAELTLNAGDRLFLYTDGVTEALNSAEEEFGNKRLLAALKQFGSDVPEELAKHIYGQLEEFSRGCPQYDDITMLILDYPGGPLTLAANVEELPKLQNYLEQACSRNGLGINIENHLQIAAEEVFLNIVNHAYENKKGTVSIRFGCIPESRSVQLVFTDSGKPYDPQLAAGPDLSEVIEERAPGGLGVFLIKELVDSVDYQRKADKNILILTKTLGETA